LIAIVLSKEELQAQDQLIREKLLSIGVEVNHKYYYKSKGDKIPFTVVDKTSEFYELEGYVTFGHVIQGHKWNFSSLTQESKDRYVYKKFYSLGIKPLGNYV
jgi:hypothetical protein